MDFAYAIARPLLFALDAERAHRLTLRLASLLSRRRALLAIVRALYAPAIDRALAVNAFGLDFASPVGLAAGLDKDGEAIDFWAAIGFAFVELGTVTPGEGQPGNEAPRLERIVSDRAIVNRMGFNNKGAAHLAQMIAERRSKIPIGVNLGKAKMTPIENAPDDYVRALEATFDRADYFVVNVSSPNTPNLRSLQSIDALVPLLDQVQKANARTADAKKQKPRPILLKIAPDLADEDVDAIADLAKEKALDGIVATNTTIRRELVSRAPKIEGGVSGAPLAPRALDLTRRLFRRLGSTIPIIGVGGIGSAEDAWARMRAGARLIQIYTALIYQGPSLVARIVHGLGRRLETERIDAITRIVGLDA
jgi:dihydroorotate dehydrogenase